MIRPGEDKFLFWLLVVIVVLCVAYALLRILGVAQ